MSTVVIAPATGTSKTIRPFSALGLLAKAVQAVTTLLSNNTAPADGSTVTIGNKVYTFKTALTPTEGEVLINGTADAALLNLIRAINHTGTADTDYKCAAAHTQVTAAAAVTAHAFAITSILGGTAANAYATSTTSATLSFTSTTLVGGVETEDLILLSDEVIEANEIVMLSGFDIYVNGATAWNEATNVILKDMAGNIFATVLKAALTGTTHILPLAANVGAAWSNGGAAGRGLKLAASSNETTGNNLLVRVWGSIVTP